MLEYQSSSIWQKTLAPQIEPDLNNKQREQLRAAFESIREKAKQLADEIHVKLPDYTVHGMSHIDALWEMSELIVPKDYTLNPAEVFVLGVAFLLHDLGMALAAFPMGIEGIKKEQIWLDSKNALVKNNKYNEETAEKLATEKTLRVLHGKTAKNLPKISWKNSQDNDIFLIDNEKFRTSYGDVIGLVAYSHNIPVENLESELPGVLGALPDFPQEWTVDSIKLACIIRLSDAMQIDDRRAPSFLKSIRNPSKYSESYWRFQEKLYQPRIENNRVVFTSKSSFEATEANAWWCCFDTLKMIDNEFKQVDALLAQKNRKSFNIFGVHSIDDVKKLSKLVTVNGWQPVDVNIKVNNVGRLVSTIGGSQLYGDNAIVPLRELVQNASDAIKARRLMDDEDDSYGSITVTIDKDDNGDFIEVEDDGIGMSEKVLTGPFLDFGQSFWGTELMHEELPGLESKGYASTGKYGIGFFSLFMWSNKISVTTNRYNCARGDTLVLEFKEGVSNRPLLRKAEGSEEIKNGGTRVKVWIKPEIIREIKNDFSGTRKDISFDRVIEKIFSTFNCDISLNENGTAKQVIKANDWITLDAEAFLKRICDYEKNNDVKSQFPIEYKMILDNLSIIYDSKGKIIGRGALCRRFISKKRLISINGVVTIGGARSCNLSGIAGVLIGESERASRDIALPIISTTDLRGFVESQLEKLSNYTISDEIQIEYAQISRALCGKTGLTKIAQFRDGYLNYNELVDYVKQQNCEQYILVQDAAISNYEREGNQKISLENNVFCMSMVIPGILQTKNPYSSRNWPKRAETYNFYDYTLKGRVIEAIADAWECTVEELYSFSDFSDDDNKFSDVIGTCNGKDVVMNHISIIKKKKK